MKARHLIAALTLSTVVAAPAVASISTGNLTQDIQSALPGSGNVNVTLVNGVATLSGHVDGAGAKMKLRQAALAHDDVERVIDLVIY